MAKVLLYSTNRTCEPYPVYPLGMAMVAGALQRAGHQVEQFDLLASGEDWSLLQSLLEEFVPEVICYSLRNIDNVDSLAGEQGWYLDQAREAIAFARRYSVAPVVIGGPALTIMPEEIFAYVGADHAVIGEGERLVPELVARLVAGEKVPALNYAAETPLAGESLQEPLRRSDWVRFYVGESDTINLQSKRGCPFRCSYCTYPGLEGSQFRFRPVAAVVEEMTRAQAEYGTHAFFFTDSIFNDPEDRYLQIAEELLRRDLKVRWSGYFRPQGLDRAKVALLKRSGLMAVEFGTDATTDVTLAELEKGFQFADVLDANQACVAEGIPAAHFVIFGGPGESRASLAEGLTNLDKLESCVVFAFSGIRILPGTGIERRALAEGLLEAGAPLLRPRYYQSPLIDAASMNAAITASFAGSRTRIFPPSEGQARLAVMRNFGFKGLLWDHLLAVDRQQQRG
ncbi:B12-binding domain-containing radical SAM protein [Geothermobacter hydrogeniphilus]|uniref:B12-binding domain-containing radical SAM protein n=1 Tax=Geothermobacter hydrogeniphilus TaxID=1969733 RepID=A0A2K2HBE2_9BACT|nr:lipid biosynthesis B12-binding/radical SAM protein [Geothermobacter hydrogeniphilus]PNU20634.1 B12-binding domain-containing radical SAM protein [Geothermobacter hydrogeniphilus]